jgi:hypothetical protein
MVAPIAKSSVCYKICYWGIVWLRGPRLAELGGQTCLIERRKDS